MISNTNFDKNLKINFCLSKQCFLCCPGCYNIFSQKLDISYRKLLKFIKYAKSKGVNKITLSGGDPLAKKGLIKFLKKLIKLNLIINLDTVGTPFIKNCKTLNSNKQTKIKKIKDLSVFKKLNMVGIPIDASCDDIAKTFRTGRKNFTQEQLEILDTLNKSNVNICVNTVAHKNNLNDIENIYYLIKDFENIKKWQIFEFMPIGTNGSSNAKNFKLKENEFENLKSKIKNLNTLKPNFKSNKERLNSYMLVNSNGIAYKVGKDSEVSNYGDIKDKKTWANIISNL